MSLTLDLAFSLDPALPADLLRAAGPLWRSERR